MNTNALNHYQQGKLFVTGSAKKGLIADPNRTHLEFLNLTCEFSTTLKLSPNTRTCLQYTTIVWCAMKVIA